SRPPHPFKPCVAAPRAEPDATVVERGNTGQSAARNRLRPRRRRARLPAPLALRGQAATGRHRRPPRQLHALRPNRADDRPQPAADDRAQPLLAKVAAPLIAKAVLLRVST